MVSFASERRAVRHGDISPCTKHEPQEICPPRGAEHSHKYKLAKRSSEFFIKRESDLGSPCLDRTVGHPGLVLSDGERQRKLVRG